MIKQNSNQERGLRPNTWAALWVAIISFLWTSGYMYIVYESLTSAHASVLTWQAIFWGLALINLSANLDRQVRGTQFVQIASVILGVILGLGNYLTPDSLKYTVFAALAMCLLSGLRMLLIIMTDIDVKEFAELLARGKKQ